MKKQTSVVASVQRRFDKSAERVFDAFLDPEKAGRFMFSTPTGQMVKVEIDARVGGRFNFVDRRAGEDVEHHGEYLELERPSRLVFTLSVPKYADEVDRVAIDIVPEAGGGCVLTLTHEMDAKFTDIKRQVEAGWADMLDGVAVVLDDESSGKALILADGALVWSFEQRLAAAPEVAFRALTEPEQLARWFPFEIRGGRALGAELTFVDPSGELPPEHGVITEYESPRVIAYGWGEQHFRWVLAPEGEGSRLVLQNTFSQAMKVERDEAACWGHCQHALEAQLDALARHLSGG
jgi:uncharacterized protein YndB with AHSA1/START domain